MNKSNMDLCLGCMSRMGGQDTCPQCGHDRNEDYNTDYCPPGSVIGGRYLVGTLKKKNGDGATYIGYDNNLAHVVWIREYYPTTLASRNQATGIVSPLEGCGAQYKALMADFEELCNEVRRLSISDDVVPIENIVPENNTLYAVYKNIGAMPLEKYLGQKGGKLPLDDAIDLLLPLCDTISNMHAQGVIHRGISSYSVYIDRQSRLYLWDFSLSPTRTADSELEAELFNGYSAPEQYATNGWQGTWTDVYAVAALFYRMVSGFVPPKSTLVSYQRPIAPLIDLVLEMPENISDAVAEAMQTSTQARTQTVAAFTSQLFVDSEGESTAVYDTNKLNREVPEKRPRGKKQRKEGGVSIKYVLLALFCTVLVLGGVMWVLLTTELRDLFVVDNTSSTSSTRPNSGDGVDGGGDDENTPENLGTDDEGTSQEDLSADIVPSFLGMTFDEILSNLDYQERYTFQTTQGFSDEYPKGQVYQQTPAEGAALARGTILLYVSNGPRVIIMPDLVGMTLEEATAALKEMGDEYEMDIAFSTFEKYDPDAEPGTVCVTAPAPGVEFDPTTQMLDLYIALEPEVSETSVSSSSSQSSSSRSSSSQSSNPPKGGNRFPEQDGDIRR